MVQCDGVNWLPEVSHVLLVLVQLAVGWFWDIWELFVPTGHWAVCWQHCECNLWQFLLVPGQQHAWRSPPVDGSVWALRRVILCALFAPLGKIWALSPGCSHIWQSAAALSGVVRRSMDIVELAAGYL